MMCLMHDQRIRTIKPGTVLYTPVGEGCSKVFLCVGASHRPRELVKEGAAAVTLLWLLVTSDTYGMISQVIFSEKRDPCIQPDRHWLSVL